MDWVSMNNYCVLVRVGIDLIKLIKSSIKSLIKSMWINQGIDLFNFFEIIMYTCMWSPMHDSWQIWKIDSWEEGRKVYPYLSPTHDELTAADCMIWFNQLLWGFPCHILSLGKSVQRSLIAKCPKSHTKTSVC